MIARGAESNPSCFSPTPLKDVEETLIPSYLRLSKYLDNHWALTKFCVNQFKGQHVNVKKAEAVKLRLRLSQSKGFDDLTDFVGAWTGKEEFEEIVKAIETNCPRQHRLEPVSELSPPLESPIPTPTDHEMQGETTPLGTLNPHPPGSGAPLFPSNLRTLIPAMMSGHGPSTPSPTPGGAMSAA